MIRVLIAWELGGGAGHLRPMTALARALRRHGARVVITAPDVVAAHAALQADGLSLLQAPLWRGVSQRPPSRSFAEVLERVGYDAVHGIAGLLHAWSGLLESVAPDVVIAEHSPTALLAARLRGIPAAACGTGFTLPPRQCPLPGLQPWSPGTPGDDALAAEQRVLDRIASAVARAGGTPDAVPPTLSALYETPLRLLRTYPELDHHTPRCRGDERYLGAPRPQPDGAPPDWPGHGGTRILAYYPGTYPRLRELVEALRAVGTPAVVVARGLDEAGAAAASGGAVRVQARAVDLPAALDEATLVVSHGGHGTSADGLCAGRPLLGVPCYIEQALLVYRLTERGLAHPAPVEGGAPALAEAIRRALDDGALHRRAAAAGRRIAAEHPEETFDEAVAQVCALARA